MAEKLDGIVMVTEIEDVQVRPPRPRLIRSRVVEEELRFYIIGKRESVFGGEQGYTGPIPLPGDTGIRASPLTKRGTNGDYIVGFRKGSRGLWVYQILHQGFSLYENGRTFDGEEAAMEGIRELYEKCRRNRQS